MKRPALGVGVVSLEDVQAYAVNQLKVPKEVTNGVVLGKFTQYHLQKSWFRAI